MTKTITTPAGKTFTTRTKFRYVIVPTYAEGPRDIIRRTDDRKFAEALAASVSVWELIDTTPTADTDGTCGRCGRTVHVRADFDEFGAHWTCLADDERAAISAAFRKARGIAW